MRHDTAIISLTIYIITHVHTTCTVSSTEHMFQFIDQFQCCRGRVITTHSEPVAAIAVVKSEVEPERDIDRIIISVLLLLCTWSVVQLVARIPTVPLPSLGHSCHIPVGPQRRQHHHHHHRNHHGRVQ